MSEAFHDPLPSMRLTELDHLKRAILLQQWKLCSTKGNYSPYVEALGNTGLQLELDGDVTIDMIAC